VLKWSASWSALLWVARATSGWRRCYHGNGSGEGRRPCLNGRPALLKWETGLAPWGCRSCYILLPRPNAMRRPTSLPCIGPLSLPLYSTDGLGAVGATMDSGAALLPVAKGTTMLLSTGGVATMGVRRCYGVGIGGRRRCFRRRAVMLLWMYGVAADGGR
jgi:hypothetical protein